jgi:hypothetical protein
VRVDGVVSKFGCSVIPSSKLRYGDMGAECTELQGWGCFRCGLSLA